MKAFLSIALVAVFALSGVAYDPPANTNSYTRNGVTYAQRGGMGPSTYVVTNVTPTGVARTLPPYLHCADFADTYPADAEWYYERADIIGGCSCFLHDLHFGRDYDWFRDEAAVFVGRVTSTETRFASVGVMSVGTNITEEIANSGQWTRFFKCLPGATLDGINSEGVVACINVVHKNDSEWEIHRGTRDINAIGAVRWILDNAPNAEYAATNIAARVFIPQSLIRRGYSAHFMIADETSVWIVEDGVAHQTQDGSAVMTNFRLFDAGGDMHTQRYEVQEYDQYGTGLERLYWIYRHLSDIHDRLDSPEAVLKAAWFSEAYRRPFQRPTEFVGMEQSLTLRSPDSELEAWAEAHIPQGAPESLKSGGGSWMTVHSSVYDITNRILRVAVKEKDDWYAFGLPLGGRVKSVNGKTGDVALNYWDVGALPNNKMLLIDNANFREAVEEVTPDLPEKWALANVTNAQGQAVTAADIGALDNIEASVDSQYDSWRILFPYFGHSGNRHYIDLTPRTMRIYRDGEYLDIGFGGVTYENERGGVFESDWFDFVTKDTVVKSIGGGDEDMPPSVGALRTYLGQNYTEAYIISRDYLKKSEASSTYETQSHASSTYETQSHASATYAGKAAIADAATALSNRVNDAKNEITVLHAADSSQYINGKGEVYRPSGTPPVELVMPNAAFNSYINFEMTYDEETHRYFTDNRGFINCYGPRGGGASMLFMFYQDAGTVHQWVLYGNNSWVVDTADDDPTADWLHFQYSGMWRRPTSSGTVHADDLAYKSDLEGISPADYETVSNRAMHAIQYGEIEPPADYANVSNAAMWASNTVAGIRIDHTDTIFSNEVLAVGLNIDTNSVAVLNEIAATFGGFPIAGTSTTVGGLLAALAAAVAMLNKRSMKYDAEKDRYYTER